MANVEKLAAYGRDLLNLLAFQQSSGAKGSTTAGATSNQSSATAQTGAQAANFTLTPVIFTTSPTGSAVDTNLQVYDGTSSLPPVHLTADQLKAIREIPTPQAAPIDFGKAQQLLESAESNDDGTISQAKLESMAVSSGSNVQQADALFKELTPDGGDSMNVNQILSALENTSEAASS